MKDIVYKSSISTPKINYHRGKGGKPRCHRPLLRLEIRKLEGKKRTIDLDYCRDVLEVSLTFDVRSASGDGGPACGCGVSDFVAEFYNEPELLEIGKLADKWHLNAMKSGTRVQQAALDGYSLARETGSPSYDEACTVLKSLDLYEDRGCKYGHADLVELLSSSALARLMELFPDPSINKLVRKETTNLTKEVAAIKNDEPAPFWSPHPLHNDD